MLKKLAKWHEKIEKKLLLADKETRDFRGTADR